MGALQELVKAKKDLEELGRKGSNCIFLLNKDKILTLYGG